MGTYLLLKLADLKKRYPTFGDVRGKGLMIGIDLVENPEKREPLGKEKFSNLFEFCKDAGLIIGKGGLFSNVTLSLFV